MLLRLTAGTPELLRVWEKRGNSSTPEWSTRRAISDFSPRRPPSPFPSSPYWHRSKNLYRTYIRRRRAEKEEDAGG